MIGRSNVVIDGIYNNGFLEAFKCKNEKYDKSNNYNQDRAKISQRKERSIFELHNMYFRFI